MAHLNRYAPLFAFVVALGAAACSSSTDANSAPVIDSLDLPDTAVKEGAAYSVTGTVTYHDDDAVKTMRIYTPAGAKDPTLTINVPGGGASGTAALKVIFNGSPGLSIDYEISIVDSLNLESARSKKTVKIP
jgi:hypothetical protein